ncbi:MAG TPA: hypothetical protein VKP67_03985 [Xanthobacteraceae bacterium]|nr:hypothetical protein [Xanthobacteraceae bacterium]
MSNYHADFWLVQPPPECADLLATNDGEIEIWSQRRRRTDSFRQADLRRAILDELKTPAGIRRRRAVNRNAVLVLALIGLDAIEHERRLFPEAGDALWGWGGVPFNV